MPKTIIIITNTGRVKFQIKSINENPAALPIIMFGGSPIKVAVPPIFDENISVSKYGIGFISSFLAIANVIGKTRITVVTLSKNALVTAVNKPSAIKILIGCPFVAFKSSFAIQVNTPLLVEILTIIIIETRRNITLKSTKLIK